MAPDHHYFFNRDISWLSFNERVLLEAGKDTVPLMERIRFLSIYSSNLDEFYRVRVPALKALQGLAGKKETKAMQDLLSQVNDTVVRQQRLFGSIFENQILKALRQNNIFLVYNEPIPEPVWEQLHTYFMHHVAAYIQIVKCSHNMRFFPENNKLYLAVSSEDGLYIVNIPSDSLSRFYVTGEGNARYIFFLDDIVKLNLAGIIGNGKPITCRSFKITRDAELDLQDEFSGNLARKIEKKILQRDRGLATRFLYDPGIAHKDLEFLKDKLGLKGASFIPGGAYHNLKDLSGLPLSDPRFHYEAWPQLTVPVRNDKRSLFQDIRERDILLHPPYHTYDVILRFFNEAAIDPAVSRIYVTLYRVASDSRIANALISAARNGKKVVVFVELKARFDEANNIKWSKKMKAAGVQIIESIPGLKVHAKIALVKRKTGSRPSVPSSRGSGGGSDELFGVIATGNFNENTARYYTDHILLTAHQGMLKEVEALFGILKKRKSKKDLDKRSFDCLLVGQFNLPQRFVELIDREIGHARKGLPASVTIKFNNLEDTVLITKLYEASGAGVKIALVVRGICCLVPGVQGMSENITVKRIVDRYLEHGRIFVFHNNGDPEVYLGSADWMNRNIYRRIEVCFLVYDAALKAQLIDMINIQLADNCQAVIIDAQGNNVPVERDANARPVRSQKTIGEMLHNATEQRFKPEAKAS